jgi:cellulose synthase/poly-beta-1,6-N-acetylglucosamine synthase-like glycosyltransferase
MMTIVLNVMLTFLACALSLPAAVFSLEVVLSLLPRRRAVKKELPEGARVAVLIPAHDEEAVMGRTLETLIPTMPAGGRVLVVADNCRDGTARVARECGAEVVERFDMARRGKGFALDFGIRYLSLNPPDAAVFLDADCRVAADTVRVLSTAAIETQRPVQGLNLCDPDPQAGALQLVSGLAFRFKNFVRTLGLVRLAGLCHLTGTGMAMPWSLVANSKLADGNVVEDMQLGIEMALTGRPAMFLPEARVDSPLPQRAAAARTQRTRWEHGHLKTILVETPRLLWLAIGRRRFDLFWLALDLAVPPLSFLVLMLVAASGVSAAAWWWGDSRMAFAILAADCAIVGAAVFIGWAAHCRKQVPLWALFVGPFYALAKLPIYAAFFVKRQTQWIRTERDAPATSPNP